MTCWRPANEDELRDALVAGDLHESHTYEFKRELAPAQFAIDGGTLFIGVAEQQGGPPRLNPVPLDGLQERRSDRPKCDRPSASDPPASHRRL